jgi:hypothetical protein
MIINKLTIKWLKEEAILHFGFSVIIIELLKLKMGPEDRRL